MAYDRRRRSTGRQRPIRRTTASQRPVGGTGRRRVTRYPLEARPKPGLSGNSITMLLVGVAAAAFIGYYAVGGGQASTQRTREKTEAGRESASAKVPTARPGSVAVKITDEYITINGQSITIPTSVSRCKEILGRPTRAVHDRYTLHVWDDLGVYVHEASHGLVVQLSFYLKKYDIDFLPHKTFSGTFHVDGTPIRSGDTPDDVHDRMRIPQFIPSFVVKGHWRRNRQTTCVTLDTSDAEEITRISIGGRINDRRLP